MESCVRPLPTIWKRQAYLDDYPSRSFLHSWKSGDKGLKQRLHYIHTVILLVPLLAITLKPPRETFLPSSVFVLVRLTSSLKPRLNDANMERLCAAANLSEAADQSRSDSPWAPDLASL